MAERVFLDERGVKVTQARFIVPGQTYAMAGVTSVSNLKESPSRKGPIILIIIGLLVTLVGFSANAGAGLVGLLILALGVLWLWLLKPTYYVALRSASGEGKALKNKDAEWISQVVAAVNEAIVARG